MLHAYVSLHDALNRCMFPTIEPVFTDAARSTDSRLGTISVFIFADRLLRVITTRLTRRTCALDYTKLLLQLSKDN